MVKAVAVAQGWEYERHSDFSQVLNWVYLATNDDRVRLLRGRGTLRARHRRGHRRWQPGVGGRAVRPPQTAANSEFRFRHLKRYHHRNRRRNAQLAPEYATRHQAAVIRHRRTPQVGFLISQSSRYGLKFNCVSPK